MKDPRHLGFAISVENFSFLNRQMLHVELRRPSNPAHERDRRPHESRHTTLSVIRDTTVASSVDTPLETPSTRHAPAHDATSPVVRGRELHTYISRFLFTMFTGPVGHRERTSVLTLACGRACLEVIHRTFTFNMSELPSGPRPRFTHTTKLTQRAVSGRRNVSSS